MFSSRVRNAILVGGRKKKRTLTELLPAPYSSQNSKMMPIISLKYALSAPVRPIAWKNEECSGIELLAHTQSVSKCTFFPGQELWRMKLTQSRLIQ